MFLLHFPFAQKDPGASLGLALRIAIVHLEPMRKDWAGAPSSVTIWMSWKTGCPCTPGSCWWWLLTTCMPILLIKIKIGSISSHPGWQSTSMYSWISMDICDYLCIMMALKQQFIDVDSSQIISNHMIAKDTGYMLNMWNMKKDNRKPAPVVSQSTEGSKFGGSCFVIDSTTVLADLPTKSETSCARIAGCNEITSRHKNSQLPTNSIKKSSKRRRHENKNKWFISFHVYIFFFAVGPVDPFWSILYWQLM